MKYLFLILSQFAFVVTLYAQFSGSSNTLNITGPQSTLKAEIPLAEPSVIGSTYLDDKWQDAAIVLSNGFTIPDIPVKIEIEQSYVEISYNGEVKYLKFQDIDYISALNQLPGKNAIIKNANGFKVNNVPLKGVVKVYQQKKYSMVKHYYIEFLQANYNVAMDVGSKDHRKVKKEKLYLAKEGTLFSVKGPSKKVVAQLGDDKEKAALIVKQHKLNLSNENDLLRFIELMAI
jgi:hypothetical protein